MAVNRPPARRLPLLYTFTSANNYGFLYARTCNDSIISTRGQTNKIQYFSSKETNYYSSYNIVKKKAVCKIVVSAKYNHYMFAQKLHEHSSKFQVKTQIDETVKSGDFELKTQPTILYYDIVFANFILDTVGSLWTHASR